MRVACVNVTWIFAVFLPASDALENRTIQTYEVGTGHAVTIDGVVDSAEWKDALRLELGYEVLPGENVTPPVKTELFLLVTEDGFAAAFRCQDARPAEIRARYNDHDDLFKDDWVGIMLDTFNDQRRAYEFVVNPVGVQMDAINDEVGGNYDTTWNAIWTSASRLTETGWEVEMMVPFHQLRFQDIQGPQTWGFDAFRSYPREYRHHIGLWPRQRGANSYLGQADKIAGIEGASPGANLEIVPTVTAFESESRSDPSNADFDQSDSSSEAGATVRWGITPNMTLNATLNPDFSQVEADAVNLDINEQFALFFPETRPFFQEGADTYETPLDLVHTRSVANPAGALKLSGKSGSHTFGTFLAQDDITNIVVPGSQGSRSTSFDFQTTDFVGRYRYDFGKNSTVGAMATRRDGDGYHNQVISADLFYRISDSDKISLNLASSDTEYNSEIAERLGVTADQSFSDQALVASYRHDERDWWAYADYVNKGEDFRADLGFIPQVGIQRAILGGGMKWYFEKINEVRWGADWDMTEDQDGVFIEREYETWVNLQGPLQSSINGGLGTRDRAFDSIEYEQDFYWFNGSLQPNRILEMGGGFSGSDWIDFMVNREADQFNWDVFVHVRQGRHLNLSMAYRESTLDVAEGRLFTTRVPELRLVYYFNERIFLRWIGQYFEIERSPELHVGEVPQLNRDWFNQVLFAYKLNPQTVGYLGYTDQHVGDQDISLTQTERAVFLKLGYAWLK